jgi:hypothetical protein
VRRNWAEGIHKFFITDDNFAPTRNLTLLPGSEDHQTLWKKGVAMDPDLNVYDVEHVCTAHPTMSREEWMEFYREA